MNRRRFIKVAAAAAGTVATTVAVNATLIEPRRLTITKHRLRQRVGREGARSARIVQLTDLHLQSITPFHERLAREVAAQNPDLVVITGDSIDNGRALLLLGDFLSLLDPATPKLATWGNWEHYLDIGLPAIAGVYAQHGCRILNNESVSMSVNGSPLLVTGLDSAQDGHPDIGRALGDVAPSPNHLVLAHCPIQRDDLIAHSAQSDAIGLTGTPTRAVHRPSLVLSGHTHGGQITIGGWAPVTPVGSGRYVAGWYTDSPVPLYVSRGLGETSVPVRFGCPPEIAVFDWELA